MTKARELVFASCVLFILGIGIYSLNNSMGSIVLALSILTMGLTIISLVLSRVILVTKLMIFNCRYHHRTQLKDVFLVIRS